MKSSLPCIAKMDLDLETLLWTHGRACPLAWLQQRLKCPKCDTRHVVLFWIAPSDSQQQAV